MSHRNLAAAFSATVETHAAKTAIYWGDIEIGYRDLAAQANGFAWKLKNELSVQPGDRIAIWLKNCPEFVPVLFGIWKAGGVAVPINNFLKPEEVGFILTDCEAKVLVGDPEMGEAHAKVQSLSPKVEIVLMGEARVTSTCPSMEDSDRRGDDLAVIVYTSGTTGHPKGAMLSHGNLLSNVESCRQVLEAIDFDRFVVLLPMFHSFMLTVGILLPLLIGGSMVLVRSLHPPKNILAEIIEHQATILPAIPQFFRTLAHLPVPQYFPLRICVSGAAPLPKEILKEFNQKFPIPLLEGYGLSEASPVVAINPIRGPWKEGSIGIPVAGVEVTIQDEEGAILKPGETGELCVRGNNVMKGYWNKPEETAAVLRNGWLLTGDIGHMDEDGYIFITDRKKDMLLVNGINVYPREIEEIIYKFPGIKEAAVVSKPDPRKGEQPIAFVSLFENSSLDTKALIQFIRDHLADYKIPRQVHVLPKLPRNATGKILKRDLRKLVLEQTDSASDTL